MGTQLIEEKVANTILQKPCNIEVGGVTYEVAPPSIATLIEVSALVAKLPKYRMDRESVLMESLRIAKDCTILGDIVATLILGADNFKKDVTIKKRILGIPYKTIHKTIDNRVILSAQLMSKLTPKQVNDTTIKILNRMEVGDFFGLTASLIEVNLTKATKEAEKTDLVVEMIAYGQ